MKSSDHEEMLWEIGRRGEAPRSPGSEPTPEPVPDDAELVAFRRGELSEERRRQVAARLAASPRSRERLRALAGHRDEPPPADLRRELIGTFARPGSEPAGERPRRVGGGWWRWAAAAMLAVASLLLVSRLRVPEALPADLEYRIAVRGLAAVRSTASQPGEAVEALPETRIRIEASPLAGAVQGLEVGLYAPLGGGTIERLEAQVERSEDRGAVTFSARAAALLGDEPGTYTLFVVVARRGDLPPVGVAAQALSGGAETLRAGRRRLVFVRKIILRAPDPPALESTTMESGH